MFDINNTLVKDTKSDSLLSEYVSESIRNIYGTLVDVDLSKYAGLTSQETAEAILLENGMPQDEISPKLTRYSEDLFYSYYNVAGHDRQVALDGAKDLLDELLKEGVLLGIATGEPERIARLRLEKTDFAKYFRFGAFGNEAKTASGIIGKALEKAQKDLEFTGDFIFMCSAPNLVQSAKGAGIKCIATANGKFSEDLLRAAHADLVVRSLRDKGKILGFIRT